MDRNHCGVKDIDQILEVKRGMFLIKLFHGIGFKEFLYLLLENFLM
jgi:hypothetical protein